MWIIILVVIGLVVYFIVRSAKSREGEMNTGYDTALDILKKRYARGEISKAAYEEIKKNL